MRSDSLESILGITLRELCLAGMLLTVAALMSYPVARYYWIKASENAQVIRQWDQNYAAGEAMLR
ncbi:MAG: hypothetical protein AAF571_12420 [Verrucomicrobiota bacterium]